MKKVSAKVGITLDKVRGISKGQAKKLGELWITTAEELASLCDVPEGRKGLARHLKVKGKDMDAILEKARKMVPPPSAKERKAAEAAMALKPGVGAMELPKVKLDKTLSLSPYLTIKYPPALTSTLPLDVDWRSRMSPIKNQGSRGTCVSFASTALREYLEVVAGSDTSDLSEQFLYWNCKQNDGNSGCGTWVSVAMQCLLNDGECRESIWPYNASATPCPDAQGPLPQGAMDKADDFKTGHTITLNPKSVDDIKTCLADGKVVPFSVPVYSSWYYSATVRRYGNINMPIPGDTVVGGHAMCFVGYQDDASAPEGGYFILRNSWGTGWAWDSPYEAGYGTIPYAYIAQDGWEAYSADRIPSADVYIRDNPQDTGTVPTQGTTWNSPDVWVRLQDDGHSVGAHQNPEYGQENYGYVRVHNKGPAVAYDVEVNLYYTGFSPSIYPHNWVPIDTLTLDEIDPNETKIVGPFLWTPPTTGHTCLFVRMMSAQDPIVQDYNVRYDNNIVQKNVNIVDMLPNGSSSNTFTLNGVKGAASLNDLIFDKSQLPRNAIVQFKIVRRLADGAKKTEGLAKVSENTRYVTHEVSKKTGKIIGMTLRPDDKSAIRLIITAPKRFGPGRAKEYPLTIVQKTGELTIGKITIMVKEILKPPYVANRNRSCLEVHRAECIWVTKMLDNHRVPFETLEEAHLRGYDNCAHCIGDSKR